MTHNPERALWREVLLRQIDDALYGAAGISGTAERIRAIKDARNLLSKPSPQLDHLCALADIDPSAVVTRIGARIADAPTPEQLATQTKASRATALKRTKRTKAKRIKYENRQITFNGETLTMQQWSERTGLTVAQIASRLRNDWTVARALTQPMGKRNRTWGATGAAGVAEHTDGAADVAEHAPCAAPKAEHTDGPGVVSDFGGLSGTGGGRSAQDRPEISFPPSEEVQV